MTLLAFIVKRQLAVHLQTIQNTNRRGAEGEGVGGVEGWSGWRVGGWVRRGGADKCTPISHGSPRGDRNSFSLIINTPQVKKNRRITCSLAIHGMKCVRNI